MTNYVVGVCESVPRLYAESSDWSRLCASVGGEAPHLFLLNELPFGPWVSSRPAFDQQLWDESRAAHQSGVMALAQTGAAFVAGTRPIESGPARMNEAYLWSGDGILPVHTKQYFPDEEGYYEARWFDAGERHFRVAAAGEFRVGFLICTELMFNERARQYGRNGAQVILVPRAVGTASLDRWLVAMRMAAIVSGCYVMSSNRAGVDPTGQVFGGCGWIIDPTGAVVAQTSPSSPVVFHTIDLDLVAKAQSEYPCYVAD